MNPTCRRYSAALLIAVMLGMSTARLVHAADAPAVVSQNLKAVEASTKVSSAIWTRRADRYTLQIIFPQVAGALARDDEGQLVAPKVTRPIVTVWLLRTDGTVIPAKRDIPLKGRPVDKLPPEVAFFFDLSAGAEAVAAAIRIDDEQYVEPLQPLVGR